jgi:small subunit ribosomal protein S3
MTHNVHPYAHRLVILRDWKSRWFGDRKSFRDFLKADVLIREYLEKRLRGQYVSSVEIERNQKFLKIILETSRPGVIIGRSGEGAEVLKKDVLSFMARKKLRGADDVKIDVREVRSPESNAGIVAKMVQEGIERRLPFRRVLKQTADKVVANRDVQGVRIALSGRLGGADMARKEGIKKGRIPLQTLRADIDYAQEKAKIPQGDIGITVWIYRGEIFE